MFSVIFTGGVGKNGSTVAVSFHPPQNFVVIGNEKFTISINKYNFSFELIKINLFIIFFLHSGYFLCMA